MPQNNSETRHWPITIIGLGAVGSQLARAIRKAGFRQLTVIGKGRAGEQRLTRALQVRYHGGIKELQQEQGVIILAVREAQIATITRDLSRLPLKWQKLCVLHTAGSVGAEILNPLAALGAGIAAWHPYQTFPKKAKAVTLGGVTFGVGGNRRGIVAANRLSRALGGIPLRVSDEDRILYHLSAVLACGFVAADLDMAIEVLKKIGISDKRAFRPFCPSRRKLSNKSAR